MSCCCRALLNRYIRLVLTERGPEYWRADVVGAESVRRVRNLYYTKEFAQMVYQEMLTRQAKASGQALRSITDLGVRAEFG